MSGPSDPARKALAAYVKPLVERHGGPQKVGDAVGAHRITVNRWTKGDIGIDKLALLAEKLDEPITVRFAPDIEIEAAPPGWAERLEAKVDAIYERQMVVGTEMAGRVIEALQSPGLAEWAQRIGERLAELPSQSSEASADQPEESAPGIAARREQEPS